MGGSSEMTREMMCVLGVCVGTCEGGSKMWARERWWWWQEGEGECESLHAHMSTHEGSGMDGSMG